jgi:predicted glycoside hydrolase/deacetylase ChbG (UPF0249 family)
MTVQKKTFSQSAAALGVLLFLIAIPLYAFKVSQKTDYTDFSVYARAALRVAQGNWSGVYDLADGASPYRYAPFSLLIFRPFAFFTPAQAKLVWYFLQVAFFGGGFALLAWAHRKKTNAKIAAGISLLFTLRLIVDTYTIGQISGLLFFCWGASLYFFRLGRGSLAGAFLWLPAALKIGPALLFGYQALRRRPGILRAVLTFLGTTLLVGLSFLLFLYLETRDELGLVGEVRNWKELLSLHQELWRGWVHIVEMDSTYYDAAHYGSQSLKSFLLRLAGGSFGLPEGLLTRSAAGWIHAVLALVWTGLLLVFWGTRRPQGRERVQAEGLFFSLGVLAVLLLMPETFKYSMSGIAIPIFFLFLLEKRTLLTRLALGSTALFISFAGKEWLPDSIFFGIQQISLPFFALCLLTAAVLQEAYRRSVFRPRFTTRLLEGQPTSPLPLGLPWTADDWGLSPGVNEGILALARAGVVRRVSLMPNTAHFETHLKSLSEIPGLELGLHFNLTYGRPLTRLEGRPLFRHETPLSFLVRATWGLRFSREAWSKAIEAEFTAQVEKVKKLGLNLCYFDGHHHAHLAPGLLDCLLPRLQQELGGVPIRAPFDPKQWLHPTKWVLNVLSLRAAKIVQRFAAGIDLPPKVSATGPASFPQTASSTRSSITALSRPSAHSVLYPKPEDFESEERLLHSLRRRLRSRPTSGWKAPQEILCHPAMTNDLSELEFQDPYQAGRVSEFLTLIKLSKRYPKPGEVR